MTDIPPRYTVTDLGVRPGFEASRATALNDRGQVIGSLSREEMDFDSHGFVWANGEMRDLGKLWLKDINNKGQIVGHDEIGGKTRAFLLMPTSSL